VTGVGGGSDPAVAVQAGRGELARAALSVLVVPAIGVVLFAVTPMRGERAWVGLVVGAASVLVVLPLTVRRARRIAVSDRPIFDAIETLALLFTLLVLGFAAVYVVLAGHAGEIAGVRTRTDALYFTTSTLATVGFGDANATGQTARTVVTLQMVFDLVFIAAAVRLLAATAQRRAGERSRTQDTVPDAGS
jgi:hypothetical protein